MPLIQFRLAPARRSCAGRGSGGFVLAAAGLVLFALGGAAVFLKRTPPRSAPRDVALAPIRTEEPMPANFRAPDPEARPPLPIAAKNAPPPADPNDLNAMTESESGNEICSPQTGVVKELPHAVGARLRAGATLFVLDGAGAEENLKEARFRRDVAQATLDGRTLELKRIRELREQNVATGAELEQAEQAVKEATAELGVAEAGVSFAQHLRETLTVAMPFDGVVVRRNADVGQMLQAGQAVVTVRRLQPR